MSINLYREHGSWPTPLEAEIFRFPAGEFSVKQTGEIPEKSHIVIDVRGTNPEDIIAAGIVSRWAKNQVGMQYNVSLLLPYLPAARSDHDEVMGVDTYAKIMSTFDVDNLVTCDPHSSRSLAAYQSFTNVKVLDHTPIVINAAKDMCEANGKELTGIIAADKSGSLHVSSVAKELNVPMFQALKIRDPQTGNLSKFECEELPKEGNLLVVDDICDGGGTFMGLAEIAGVDKSRFGLWVTHGLFTGKALKILPDAYHYIASTNSARALPTDNPALHGFDITTLLYQEACKH